jgi:glycosyltransferase involved in cell wall biosynthesis
MLEDEGLRQQLSDKGIERAQSFSWDSTAATLWTAFEKMMILQIKNSQ